MAKYKKKLEKDIRCPLEYGLAIFGGKWKSRIICVLAVNENYVIVSFVKKCIILRIINENNEWEVALW